MKNMTRNITIVIVALTLSLAIASCSKSDPADKTYQMRTATPLSQHGTVGRALKMFCDLVEENSDGRIKTKIFYSGQIGNQRQQVEMVHDGSLEVVTSLASGTARYVPQLAIFEYPYIYKDPQHLVRVLDAMEPEVSGLLAPHNFIAIGGQSMGFRHMLNKHKPIMTPDDLAGLKMRGPNPIYVGMFKALGATGTTSDWSEIYSALQTGVIDGLEASPDMIASMNFHEQAPYLSKTSHIAACVYYMLRKDWFDSLPTDLQKIVTNAATDAAALQNKIDMDVQAQALEKMASQGLIINDVTDISRFSGPLENFKNEYTAAQGQPWIDLYNKISKVQ